MNSVTGQCSLFLCPVQYNFTLKEISYLVSSLQEIGFISLKVNTKQENTNSFFAGDRFLDYIAYMGCSPTIQFDAGENDSDFCYIKVHHYESAKLIHSQKQSRAPQCPSCNKPVKDWIKKNGNGSNSQTQILCDQCNKTSNIEEFNWRKMAGYAQLFIEITDIFPKEAIPQQLLLDKLADITDAEWVYFYSCK